MSFCRAEVSCEEERELDVILIFSCLVTASPRSLLLLICVREEEGDLSRTSKPLTLAPLEEESGVKNSGETNSRVARVALRPVVLIDFSSFFV